MACFPIAHYSKQNKSYFKCGIEHHLCIRVLNISVTALNPKGGMKGQPDMCFWEIDYDEDMELIPHKLLR